MEESVVKQLTVLVERITRVEAKLDLALQISETTNNAVQMMAERLAKAEASTKSAHKRLDDIEHKRKEGTEANRWWVGLIITIASIVSGVITSVLLGR